MDKVVKGILSNNTLSHHPLPWSVCYNKEICGVGVEGLVTDDTYDIIDANKHLIIGVGTGKRAKDLATLIVSSVNDYFAPNFYLKKG